MCMSGCTSALIRSASQAARRGLGREARAGGSGKQGVAQLPEAALDIAALEEPEAAERPKGIVIAERDQRPEVAERNGATTAAEQRVL
jgi:hypothetical protein